MPSGEYFDASSEPNDPAARNPSSTQRPFLGVQFTCCRTYVRIYKSPDGSAYEGHCPLCAQPIRIPIGEGGTGHRFFIAGD